MQRAGRNACRAHPERVQADEEEEPEPAKAENKRNQEHGEGRELLAREERQRGVACHLVTRGVVRRHHVRRPCVVRAVLAMFETRLRFTERQREARGTKGWSSPARSVACLG